MTLTVFIWAIIIMVVGYFAVGYFRRKKPMVVEVSNLVAEEPLHIVAGASEGPAVYHIDGIDLLNSQNKAVVVPMPIVLASGWCAVTKTHFFLPSDLYRVAVWLIRYKFDGHVAPDVCIQEETEPYFRPSLTAGDMMIDGTRQQGRFARRLGDLRSKLITRGYVDYGTNGNDHDVLYLTPKGFRVLFAQDENGKPFMPTEVLSLV